jgi:hypothetical protein
MSADSNAEPQNDGLTDAERAELAADTASGGAPTQAQAADAQAAAAAEAAKPTEEQADAAAAAAKETKPDPTAAALSALAESQERTAAVLADVAKAVAKDPPPAAAAAAPTEPDWDAQRRALKEKFDKGELDDSAYETEREKLIEQKAEWRAEQKASATVQAALKQQDELRARQQQEELDAQWNRSLREFMAVETNAAFLSDNTRTAAFNAVLTAVAGEMPGANYAQMLNEALLRTQKAFGVSPPPAAAAAVKAADDRAAIEKAVAARAAQAGNVPPDLSRAPQAGADDGRGNKFQDLDVLGVNDLENRLARMTPDQIEEFLESAPGGLRDNPRS